jgi:hypothetical protein
VAPVTTDTFWVVEAAPLLASPLLQPAPAQGGGTPSQERSLRKVGAYAPGHSPWAFSDTPAARRWQSLP